MRNERIRLSNDVNVAGLCYIWKNVYMADALVDLELVLKTLADRTRLRILGLLQHGEICVCDIHEALKTSQPKVSRHLAALRRAKLVVTRRDGLWVHYRLAVLDDPNVADVVSAVRAALASVGSVQRDVARLPEGGACVSVVPVALVRHPARSATRRRPAVS